MSSSSAATIAGFSFLRHLLQPQYWFHKDDHAGRQMSATDPESSALN